jgi:phospholipid/cholesterol/gamma-HCH transport system substrate-binding protein
MRSFRERNPVVIGAIGLTVLAGLVLAAFHIDDLPLIGGGTGYRAAFRDASGLIPGNEVRVAGVKVGKVTDVGLARAAGVPYVRIGFRVDGDNVRLGPDTSATIRIKTVLGQKYLALEPAGEGRLAEGSEIPLSRTASPFDVMQAVTGLADTLDQIDAKQLATAFTVLSQAFADTPASVQASLTGLSRLSQSIASRDTELRELLNRARGVTAVLAQRDEEFRRLVTDGNLLLAEVSRRRDAIHHLLVATNALANQLSGLVADNRTQLEPALRQLRGVVGTLQRNRANLEKTLAAMAPFVNAFANVVGNGRWFDSYLAGLLQPFQPAVAGR